MSTIVVGKRHIPLEHVALVEPFDPALHPGLKSEKSFKARLVLIDRQSVLTEETVDAFAGTHGFRMLKEEGVAINPAIRSFGVENFVPAEGFEPTKPFLTRLSWRDLDGNTQSKLLLSAPEAVLAIAVTGGSEPAAPSAGGGKPSGGSRKPTASIDRRKARRRQPEAAPT
jgi:hypothetical protein